jgi:predicted aldo/keto reductase-like oxidoreductase
MRRRIFVGSIFAGLPIAGAFAQPPRPRPGNIPMRPFGRTGVNVTVIGQGGARMQLLRTQDACVRHLRHAFALGMNFFDCAASYWEGHSEEAYGAALAEVRKEIFLTTKSGQRSRKGAEAELEASLKRLRTDHVDLWQIHGVGNMKEVERIFGPGGAIEAFVAAKKSGKCRFIGFTGHEDPEVLVAMLKRFDQWDSILMPLHAADTHYVSFEKIALPEAVERGVARQAMKVFGNAFLLRALNAHECLHYALSLGIHTAVVGCSTDGQLDDDVRAAQSFKPLTPAQMDELRAVAKDARGAVVGRGMEYWKKQA